jgi:predicted ATP-grasp superfamily ATP-dependent carboligase
MVLQKYISGTGTGIFGLATEKGVIAWSGHRRLRMMNPHGSGSSACELARKLDVEMKQACERFISESGWKGLFMIELLRDETGKHWFMELNGRCWGSMALARRAGFEYPAWAAQSVLRSGSAINIGAERNGPVICRHLGRELLYLMFVMRGAKSKAIERWPSVWKAFRDVLRFGRNDYWYNWRRDDAAVFFSDCYRTVRDQVLKPKKMS